MIRHPCSVAASQIRSGYSGYNDFLSGRGIGPGKEEIIDEARKIGLVDINTIRKIEKIDTPEELLAAVWCLDNYVPLASTQRSKLLLATYEKLIMTPQKGIKDIADTCGIVCSRKNIEYVTNPSKNASSDLTISDIRQLSKWKNHLSKDQVTKILNIVSAFGLDFYNDAIPPDYKSLEKNSTKVL